MKNYKLFSLIAGVILILAGLNIYIYYQHYLRTNLDCQGNSVIKNESGTLNIRVSLSLFGSKGQTILEGELISNVKGNMGYFRKSATYDIKQKDNYIFITNNTNASFENQSAIDGILKDMIPEYFFYTHVVNSITLYPLLPEGYLVGNNQYIYLYCKN